MTDSALRQIARWACGLKLDQVPARVREQAVNQILSTLAAVYSGWDSDLGGLIERAFPAPGFGPARVLPTGTSAPVAHAALLMASWSMVQDYDDVMLGGHTGHSSVLVPFAFGSAGGRSGAELVLAQIVANEVAARINMACAVGSTRGQMATHVHLLGASAARAKLEHLDEEQFVESLSFALSYPGKALFPAFLGSDAKVLCAGLPVRVGVEAVDAVKAGLTARADVLEDPRGFFASLSCLPVREFLGGLGERWHTETNSYKIYPVCGYLCSALDATLDLIHEHDIRPEEIASVDVWASLFTVAMDAHSAPYLDGPESRISTLTFSTPFTVASAIVARGFGPAQLRRTWIENPKVWELAARVRSRLDLDLTLTSLRADIPMGAALCRISRTQAAAYGWNLAKIAFGSRGRWRRLATLKLIGGLVAVAGDRQPLDFQTSTKPMGARVEIRLADGRVLSRVVAIPRGFAGARNDQREREEIRELMREKFIRSAGAVIGPGKAVTASRLIERMELLSPSEVADLFDLACLTTPSEGRTNLVLDDEARLVCQQL